ACTTDGDCTAMGAVCEPTGYCSFVDPGCADGRRYGEYSGSYANQCVGGMATSDGGIDAPGDGSQVGCPTDYAALPGPGPHVYKLTANAQQWMTQRDRCAQDGAYLAIPDSTEELQAITTAGAEAKTWIGITDAAVEGTYETVKGDPATFLPWASGEPNNQGGQDCVSALMASPTIATDNCGQMLPAVCECEP